MHHQYQVVKTGYAVLLIVGFYVGGAQAAYITDAIAPLVGGTGGTVESISFPSPAPAEGNDVAANNTRSNPNFLNISKTFTNPTPGAEINIEFTVACDPGDCTVTEYVVTEQITNGTSMAMSIEPSEIYEGGLPIGEVDLFVGFGGVRSGEAFQLSQNPDGLDFDQEGAGPGSGTLDAPFPTSDVFTACDLCTTGDGLFFKNGILQPGQTATLYYQLDVPEVFELGEPGSGVFNIPPGFGVSGAGIPGFDGGYRFTLQQSATFVPVPPAFVLFAGAIASLVGMRRRSSRT